MIWELFINFFKIGMTSFGGGLASLAVIQAQIVDNKQWIDLDTFTNMVTISEMTPGPIGINAATFIGMQLNGLLGAIAATLGFVVPSFIIVSILSKVYLKYQNLEFIQIVLKTLRPVVVALIFSAGLKIFLNIIFIDENYLLKDINIQAVSYFIVTLILIRNFKMSAVLAMFLIGFINIGVNVFF